MNKNVKTKKKKKHAVKVKEPVQTLLFSWMYNKLNLQLFAGGILLIIIGFIAMETGTVDSFQSLTLAPIFLFVGYFILIPSALIFQKAKK